MELQNHYRGKKVFLTGHTGFKGSWMLAWLHSLGATVKGYALHPEPDNDLYHAIKGDSVCQSVIADIRDEHRLSKELSVFQPDIVFHFAAQPLVRKSYEIPNETFAVNTQGTANVLEAVRHYDGKCSVVIITTDKVYENRETGRHFREDDRLGGHDPYSASKAAAEIVVESYRSSFFHPERYASHGKSVSSARAGNVIGGGDMAKDRIIPDLIRSLSSGIPATIRNPASVRPWEHVLEPIHGYLVLAAAQSNHPVEYAEAFNFGPHLENTIDVRSLAEKVIESWGQGSLIESAYDPTLKEAGILQLDIEKAMNRLSWRPKLSFDETIALTVNWYKDRLHNRKDPRDLMLRDIEYFQSKG